jgi:hypothetical protein
MTDTIRKRCLDALIARLEESNLFTWATNPAVNPGKMDYRKKEELPAISIFVRAESAEVTTYGQDRCTMSVDISGITFMTRDATTDVKESAFDLAELIRGELIHAAVTTDFQDMAEKIDFVGGDVVYPAAEDQALAVGVSFDIEYYTMHNNPYE